MARRKQQRKSKSRREKKREKAPCNCVSDAAPGCHIANEDGAGWIVGIEAFDREEYGLSADDPVPDISLDPNTGMLSVINDHSTLSRSYFLTTTHPVLDSDGRVLPAGTGRDEDGQDAAMTTLILVVRPLCIMEVGRVVVPQGKAVLQARYGEQVQLHSDVKEIRPHLRPQQPVPPTRAFPFPLGGQGPFLCTQGFGGALTHFFGATWHAVDLECPVGTPILAVADGVVVEVRDGNAVGGIATRNLFLWNSVTIRTDGGVIVEYVHVAAGGAAVARGDRVAAGQVVAASGDVGFCPRPHLHIQVHESAEADAETVPFVLLAADGSPYVPKAGAWYGPSGPAPPP
ncbi:unnamed protein product [Phaeothamnion confervicola]